MAEISGKRRSVRTTRGRFPRRYRDTEEVRIEPAKRRKPAQQFCWLFQLPDEVWAIVRDLAGAEEAIRFALTCRASLDFAKSPGFWQLFQQPRFDLRNQRHPTVLRLFVQACLRASWSVREIRTSYPYYVDKRGWTDYKRCGLDKVAVETLIMVGRQTYNQELEFAEGKVLDDFKCVQRLLTGETDDICRHLPLRPSTQGLRALELARQSIRDESFEALQGLTELRSLRLDSCQNLTDRALALLMSLPRLEELSVKRCDGISGSGLRGLQITKLTFTTYERAANLMQQLGSLTKLRELDLLQYYGLSLADLDTLATVKLSSLKLSLVNFASDELLQRLADQAGLRVLRCRACPHFTESGLAALRRCPTFEELYLEGCQQITDLSVLGTFPALHSVHLGNWNATVLPAGLPLCRRLRELQLGYYEITDAITNELTQCSMQELELMSCTFNTDVAPLGLCPALRELRVKFSVHLPQQALAELRQARPELRVVTVDFGTGFSPYSWDN